MRRMIAMASLVIILALRVEALPSAEMKFDFGNKLSPVIQLNSDTTKAKQQVNRLEVPLRYDVKQNHPNPFNSSTAIDYDMPWEATVFIAVYNVLGQRVRTLAYESKHAGSHTISWDGRDDSGTSVASGVYLYLVSTVNSYKIRKMILVK